MKLIHLLTLPDFDLSGTLLYLLGQKLRANCKGKSSTIIMVLAGTMSPLIKVSSLQVLVVPQMVGYFLRVSLIICCVNTNLERKFRVGK